MILIQLQNTRIYNALFVIASAFILIGSTCCCDKVYAMQFGEIKYNNTLIDYSKLDRDATEELADFYFSLALKARSDKERKEFLQKASGEYFILTQAEPKNIYPVIQLARVYDYEKEDSFAKAYFFKALKINKNDPVTNYHFAEFYYARDEYKKALYFYNIAFDNGYEENLDVILKMAVMYEKLGDILKANHYYKKAFFLNPNNKNLGRKILKLENLNYRETGYYDRNRR